jgi:uncharacterized protein
MDFVQLGPGDERRLSAYLDERPDTTMFLRSNLAAAGLADDGSRLAGTWMAAVDGGAVAGVCAHFNLGTMVLETALSPETVGELARGCAEASGRWIAGLIGPRRDVEAARGALGLADRTTTLDSPDLLFALDLQRLIRPPALDDPRAGFRRAVAADRNLLTDWRVAYSVETLGQTETPELRASCADQIATGIAAGVWYVLEWDGEPVSCAAFNARVDDMVQIGGVYTPPALRRRGFARAVVAGSLELARAAGASRAILFTDDGNPSRRAYEAVGFEVIGDYSLVLFAAPVTRG